MSALPRHSVENLGDRFRLTIPSRKHWGWIIVLGIWLAFWGVSEAFIFGTGVSVLFKISSVRAYQQLVAIFSSGWVILMLLMLGVWTIGGMFNLYGFLWQLVGRKVIEVNGQSIRVQHLVLGLGRPKEYMVERIRNLRLTSGYKDRRFGPAIGSGPFRTPDGFIAFDYGTKVVYLGSGIDKVEASQMLSAVQQRFPQYQGR